MVMKILAEEEENQFQEREANPLLFLDITHVRPIDTGAHFQMLRLGEPLYDDSLSTPRMMDEGSPSPREISNAIFDTSSDISNSYGASNLFWVWGQFIDHDITLTTETSGEQVMLSVPQGDPYFDPFNTGTAFIPTHRAGYMEETGEDGVMRQYENEITPFLDASMVYGSDVETQSALRSEDGYLKMSAGGDMLPVDESGMFYAGDVRAMENSGLTSMHTLWAKEHNYWVDQLHAANPEWDADKLYETARSIVSAEIQAITFNEFLPMLLGENAFGSYAGFDENASAQMSVEFSTAAFRLGHSLLSTMVERVEENGAESAAGHLTLRDAFFTPAPLYETGIDPIIRGLANSFAQDLDAGIIDDVRNFLFGPPGAGGLDLATLNIFRGRDMGLPDLNSAREALGLEPYQDFSQITDDVVVADRLEDLYGDINTIDLFVGGLVEDTYQDSMLGETFFTIVADQFARIRAADPFWYENILDEDMVEEVNDTSLSDVILRNTDTQYMQQDALLAYDRIGGSDARDDVYGADGSDLVLGLGDNDHVYGQGGGDEIYGGDGYDRLFGGDGNDLLFGEGGCDILYGGAGADIFCFSDKDLDAAPNHIMDFNRTEGDKIDLGDLLDWFDPVTDAIQDFVTFTTRFGQNLIAVDYDGTGEAYAFQDVVRVNTPVTYDDLLLPTSEVVA